MPDNLIILAFGLLAVLPLVALLGLRAERDGVTLLTVFLVALFGLNARYVVSGAGAIGTPAIIVAAGMAWWWWTARVAPTLGLDRDVNPVRVAVLVYLWYIALNWAITHLRPLSELEASGSTRAVIMTVALTGVALLAADGIASRARLDRLLRRVVAAGVFLAGVGMVQFFTGFDLGSLVRFPGLSLNRHIALVGTRSIFNRPFGTALHPIEFGVVLGMLVPLALHFALRGRTPAERRRYTVATVVIAAGIPMSVSRSAVVAVLAALLALALAWTWRERFNHAVLAVGFLGVMWGVVPGLIGTLRSLFANAENDPSIIARLERFPLVVEQIGKAPWFGIGHGTFNPQEYFLLDNQYYGTTIELGFVGMAITLGMLLTAMVAARWVRRRAPDPATQHLAQAMLASLAVVLVVMATFDAFAFRIFTGTTYLLLGCCGALWRLVVRDGLPAPADVPSPPAARAATGAP